MNSNNLAVSRALRLLRKREGLSQLALAVRAGVSLNTVSLAERSGRLTERTAERFATALGVTRDVLTPERSQ
jgi:transcriptional regulator with XRE-family HTH domain